MRRFAIDHPTEFVPCVELSVRSILTTVAFRRESSGGWSLSFIIAGFVCAVAALCYAEMAAMVPVSVSAYTYSYAVMGELIAWMVGWALVLEFAVAASAVSVGWSNYFVGNIERMFDVELADTFTKGLYAGGLVNLPAAVIAMLVTALLVVGTRESATVNAFLVLIKVAALVLFVVLAIPVINGENFEPFAPNGFFDSGGLGIGIAGAAASIFFAYVGFDAVATAAEETKNPQRNIPIGLIGSLAICTVFYLLVAAGAVRRTLREAKSRRRLLASVAAGCGALALGGWAPSQRAPPAKAPHHAATHLAPPRSIRTP